MPEYEVGDVVCYRTWNDTRRYVRVENRMIENGQPGFDGFTIDTHMSVWGFDHQIVCVDRRRAAVLVSI